MFYLFIYDVVHVCLCLFAFHSFMFVNFLPEIVTVAFKIAEPEEEGLFSS